LFSFFFFLFFFFSSRRRHTRFSRDWSSDVCSSDLYPVSGCIMTWNNQLSLTLKLHSSVAKDNHSSIETLCTWGEELLEDVKISRSEERRVGKECRSRWTA